MNADDANSPQPARPAPDVVSMRERFVALWRRNLLGGVVLGEGECFGEMNLLDELPRSATALALDDTHVLKLQKARLRGLLMSYPGIAIGTLRVFTSTAARPRPARQRHDEERDGCARRRTSWRRHIAGADGPLGRHASPGPSK